MPVFSPQIYAFHAHAQGRYIAGALGTLALIGAMTVGIRVFRYLGQLDRRRFAELRADRLPERVKCAARALKEVTVLVEDLKTELSARTALLDNLKQQEADTAQRAADMDKFDEDTKRILNNLVDSALKGRLNEIEQSTRRREWFIGTVIAAAVGVIAILISHIVFGF